MEAAYRDSAERAERMSGDALRAMSGQMQDRVNGERQITERTERLGAGAMAGMAEVAGSRAMADGLAGINATAQVCGKCKHTVPAEKNFCPNCGVKAY